MKFIAENDVPTDQKPLKNFNFTYLFYMDEQTASQVKWESVLISNKKFICLPFCLNFYNVYLYLGQGFSKWSSLYLSNVGIARQSF